MDATRTRILYEHNRWANQRVLDMAATVSEAAYFAEVPGLSFGSLHRTLIHLLDSEWAWFCRMRGEPRDVWKEDLVEPDFASLRARWAREEARNFAYLDTLTDAGLEATLEYEWPEGQGPPPLLAGALPRPHAQRSVPRGSSSAPDAAGGLAGRPRIQQLHGHPQSGDRPLTGY
jgi:uncharacterized damage-inducible protein DinB